MLLGICSLSLALRCSLAFRRDYTSGRIARLGLGHAGQTVDESKHSQVNSTNTSNGQRQAPAMDVQNNIRNFLCDRFQEEFRNGKCFEDLTHACLLQLPKDEQAQCMELLASCMSTIDVRCTTFSRLSSRTQVWQIEFSYNAHGKPGFYKRFDLKAEDWIVQAEEVSSIQTYTSMFRLNLSPTGASSTQNRENRMQLLRCTGALSTVSGERDDTTSPLWLRVKSLYDPSPGSRGWSEKPLKEIRIAKGLPGKGFARNIQDFAKLNLVKCPKSHTVMGLRIGH